MGGVKIEDIRTGFPKEVADAVEALTRKKGMSYAEYLWHIQQNHTAIKVKLSDLRSNMDLTRLPHTPTERDLERTRKYKRAYTILSSREGISAVNPYALYDYLLANNWSVKRKSTRTSVLETTNVAVTKHIRNRSRTKITRLQLEPQPYPQRLMRP